MSLPAGRWPTDPITVYSSSVDLAWCRFPKVRRLSEQDSDKKRKCQWKQRCIFLVWPMEREHVLYLTNEDTARSLSDQWRHFTFFIWPLETLHIFFYLLYLTNGDTARFFLNLLYLTNGDFARSLSDHWRHCTFFIWPMKTHSRSLSDQLKQYTLPTLQAPGASQNQRQAKRFLRDLKHEWLLAFYS